MTSSIAVKVGKKSNLKLTNCKAYRALSVSELSRIANLHNDCHIVIIEHIAEHEEDEARDFIEKFVNNSSDNAVIFYVPDNDDITSGLADELEIDIFLTDGEVYSYINKKFNINTSVYLKDRRAVNNENNNGGDVFGTPFDIFGTEETNEQNSADNSESVEVADTSTDDISDNVSVDNTDEQTTSEDTSEDSENTENSVVTVDINKSADDTTAVENQTSDETAKESTDETRATEAVAETVPESTEETEATEEVVETAPESTEETEVVAETAPEDTSDNASENAPETEDKADVTTESVHETGDKTETTSGDDVEAVEDSTTENTGATVSDSSQAEYSQRIAELEKVVKAVEDERDSIRDRFKKLIESEEVLEDPISLSEYKKLEKEIENRDKRIKELEDSVSSLEKGFTDNAEKMQSDSEKAIADRDKKIKELEASISTLEKGATDSAEKLQSESERASKEQDSLNQRIAELTGALSRETSYRKSTIDIFNSAFQRIKNDSDKLQELNHKLSELGEENKLISDELDKLTEKCNRQAKENADNSQKISDLSSEVENKNKEITELTDKVNDGLKRVKELTEEISDKDIKINSLTNSFNDTSSKLRGALDENSKLQTETAENIKKISKLEIDNDNLSKRAAIADNYAEETGKKLQGELDIVNAKLKLTEEKLLETEKELNNIRTTQVDSVDTVEADSSSDERISALTKEISTLKSQKEEMEKKYNDAESECRGYREIIKSISDNNTSSIIGKQVVGNVNYTGYSQIITVVGSGGKGTTVTAISIAEKLSQMAKVLYMDFDLVTPSADAWLSKSPFCQGVPGVARDTKASSLGIFFEKGMSSLSAYIDNVLINCTRTKGGGLDYFSGVYYRPDSSKIVSADYSTLFQLLSTRYTYIIVDMGRLGNSELNDSLIRAISNVAYRNIFVTTYDRFEIRNFKMKVTDFGIRQDNSSWLVNMCETQALEPKSAQSISPMPYGIILFDHDIVGKHERFLKNRINRDSLDLFLKTAVFGRK